MTYESRDRQGRELSWYILSSLYIDFLEDVRFWNWRFRGSERAVSHYSSTNIGKRRLGDIAIDPVAPIPPSITIYNFTHIVHIAILHIWIV